MSEKAPKTHFVVVYDFQDRLAQARRETVSPLDLQNGLSIHFGRFVLLKIHFQENRRLKMFGGNTVTLERFEFSQNWRPLRGSI